MSNQTYLNIENVVKQFGQFTALKDISLSIDKGEFVCFLGPSGCGKTTLLRAIAGLDLPTSGSIEQNGNDTTFLPPEKRDF
ncbi:ATP-binding cassette domain-containing protein, partial [Vibrio splendidus]